MNHLKLLLLYAVMIAMTLFAGPLLAATEPGGSDWIGKLVGVVILAGIAYFAYTRIKASKEKKDARAATKPPPSSTG
jgi:uncharacterized membrane protein YfcA